MIKITITIFVIMFYTGVSFTSQVLENCANAAEFHEVDLSKIYHFYKK